MKYYEIQMNNNDTHSLTEVYEDSNILISPNIRENLSEYLELNFKEKENDGEEYANLYKRFFYYGDPDVPWWGNDIGSIGARELMSVVCPYCGTIYLSGRVHSVNIPSEFHHLIEKDVPYHSFEAFQTEIAPLEKNFLERGILISLRPGDIFAPLTWQNPLYWNRDKIFGFILVHQRGRGFVIDEQSLIHLRNCAELTGVRIDPLQTRSIFCDTIDIKFYLVTSEYTMQHDMAAREEQGYTNVYCEQGNHWHWIVNKEAHIQNNIKFSSYRKKRQLPKRYIPDSCFFQCPIYPGGMIADERLVNLLSAIDRDAFIAKELIVID